MPASWPIDEMLLFFTSSSSVASTTGGQGGDVFEDCDWRQRLVHGPAPAGVGERWPVMDLEHRLRFPVLRRPWLPPARVCGRSSEVFHECTDEASCELKVFLPTIYL
ncbi:uncharacterized protein [Triticum aestivum]|uniref:uncharacterized protein n=1 Tax=Triticum aestivum TaxID=4565 RepID=UPI001D0046D8|nr:uncharacterized protein LOC123117033 [Triticum aestivum]